MTPDERIPLILLTGFLGSGKTTLLKSLLASPDMRDTAVLINEFGEISLDHLIVGAVEGDTVVLRNGCVCCALREDLKEALVDLLDRARRGSIPPFRRAIVETSGLADPVTIVQTLLTDPLLRHQFRLVHTVTTVDAILGADQLARFPESVRQVVLADNLVITKGDIANKPDLTRVKRAVVRLNPGSPITLTSDAGFDPISILGTGQSGPEQRLREAVGWLDSFEAATGSATRHHHHRDDDRLHDHDGEHGLAIRSLSLRLAEPLDWAAFGVWLTAILHRHGDRILRVKGILDLGDLDGPVIIQGVQSIVYPPVHLPAWPDNDRASRIVIIADGIDPELIRRSLNAFLLAAGSPVAKHNPSPLPATAAAAGWRQ